MKIKPFSELQINDELFYCTKDMDKKFIESWENKCLGKVEWKGTTEELAEYVTYFEILEVLEEYDLMEEEYLDGDLNDTKWVIVNQEIKIYGEYNYIAKVGK